MMPEKLAARLCRNRIAFFRRKAAKDAKKRKEEKQFSRVSEGILKGERFVHPLCDDHGWSQRPTRIFENIATDRIAPTAAREFAQETKLLT